MKVKMKIHMKIRQEEIEIERDMIYLHETLMRKTKTFTEGGSVSREDRSYLYSK